MKNDIFEKPKTKTTKRKLYCTKHGDAKIEWTDELGKVHVANTHTQEQLWDHMKLMHSQGLGAIVRKHPRGYAIFFESIDCLRKLSKPASFDGELLPIYEFKLDC